jgi:type I restriction enzyme S subunit
MKDGVFSLSETQDKITKIGLEKSSSNLIPKNNIIISTRMGLGRCFINKNDMAINQDLKAVFPSKKIDKIFLLWLIAFKADKIKSMGTGATVAGIRLEQFYDLDIIFPEKIKDQQKIASVLSAYDDLIENNNRRIKILEEMAQAIYNEWFVKFKFPGSPYAKAMEDKYEKVKIKNGIPEGWEEKKVEDVVGRIQSGKKYNNKTAKENGKIPILDQGKSGIIGYHNDEPGVVANENNPIVVFANHTCYQNLIMHPFSAIQNVLPFYPSDKNFRNIFWLHWATKDLIEFNDYKGHWPEFIAKKLLLPPVEICENFGNLIKPMMILKFKLEKTNNNLRKTRDLLLPKLMSGEIEIK